MKKFQLSALTKLALLVGLVLLTTAFTEEGDSRDINDRLIATTIAVDKKDGELWLYVEFANIQQSQSSGGGGGGGGGGGSKYMLVKGHGRTLPEARLNLNRQLDKPVFLSSVRTLILTEDFAKEHLLEYLYRVRADQTYRKKVITMTTRDDLDAFYKALNDRDESLGYSSENAIQTLETLGDAFARTTSRLLENLSDTYTGILLPCVGLEGVETVLTGYSVVDDTKVVGFIPIEACKGVNILKTDMAKTFYVIPYKQGQFTVDTTLMDRQIKAYYEGGRPVFKVSLKFDATLEYGDRKTPYGFSDADNAAMTAILKGLLERDVKDAIFQAQSTFKTDYLQFDDAFRVAFPAVYDEVDWGVAFQQALIATEVEVNLKSTYMLDYAADVSR
jgi:Ger(x)C family germination protein